MFPDARHAHLQLERGDDRHKVRVARSLSNPVHGALRRRHDKTQTWDQVALYVRETCDTFSCPTVAMKTSEHAGLVTYERPVYQGINATLR